MRKIEVTIETAWTGANETVEIEMPDDATQEEIEEAARDEFFNMCNYGWAEITDE